MPMIDADTEQRLRERWIDAVGAYKPTHSHDCHLRHSVCAIVLLLDTIAELRRDAARYRWLRVFAFEPTEPPPSYWDTETPEQLDAAIDSALTKQQDTDPTTGD